MDKCLQEANLGSAVKLDRIVLNILAKKVFSCVHTRMLVSLKYRTMLIINMNRANLVDYYLFISKDQRL